MLRYALLGAALSAIVGGLVLTAPAEASPVCVEASSSHPVPRTVPPTCVPYPLATVCVTQTVDAGSLAYGWVKVCVPNPQALP